MRWDVEPAAEPFLHPGRSARVLAGGEDVGWVGELHPLVARAWDLDPAPRSSRSTSTACSATPTPCPHYGDLTSFPALRLDLAVTLDDDVPAATVLATVREAGGELLAGVRVFDLYRGEQVGEGRKSLALALSFRAPDRTLTDEDVAPLRDAIVAALRDAAGRRAACLAVDRRRRLGLRRRAGRGPARPPPALRAGRRHERARTSARALTTSTRTTACPLSLEELDLERHGEVDAAIVAYPHGAAAPVVAALRERGVRVVDLSADFRLRDSSTSTSSGTSRTRTPSCSARRSTGCPSCTATQIAGADLVANPGCFPTAAMLALAPLARRG